MQSIGESLVAFTLAAALLTITPGLDTALVLRTATSEGPRRAFFAGLGIVTGCLVWASSVAIGLGALLVASRLAYTVLRWTGAAYLFYVGIKLLWQPRTNFMQAAGPPAYGKSAFVRGALTNLLNPKVGVFYVSFLPQFIPNGVPVGPFALLLGGIHALLGLMWFVILIATLSSVSRWLRRMAVAKALDRTTGAVFLLFGARLALERRVT